jgi:hypothetical protein
MRVTSLDVDHVDRCFISLSSSSNNTTLMLFGAVEGEGGWRRDIAKR